MYQKGTSQPQIVRTATQPIEFWFTMVVWHIALVVFIGVLILGSYGIWRVVFGK